MNHLKPELQRVRGLRRALALFALLLLVTTAGVSWLLPLLTPVLAAPVRAPLGAVVVTALCVPSLWYGIFRKRDISDLPKRLCAEQIIRHATEGILTMNSRGLVLSLNPAAEKIFGYLSAEVRDQPVTLLLKDAPSKDSQKFLHDSLPVGSILGLAAGAHEVIGTHKNGETFPLELTASSVTCDEETVNVVFARNVGKRKQAQRYLTAHYAATCILAEACSLAEALPRILQVICGALRFEAGAFWRWDADAGVLCCNDVYQDPSAAQPNLLHSNPLTCNPEQGLAGRVWSTGKPFWVEDLLRTKDFPCLEVAVPLQLHGAFAFPILMGQKVCGAMTFFSCQKLRKDEQLLDIMGELGKQIGQFIARKQDEEKLLRSEERFRQLAENIDEIFWMADAADGRILYLNPSYEQVWGRSCQSLQSQPYSFLDSVHPADRARVSAALEQKKRGAHTSEEYRIVRPDGSIRWVWDRAFPVRDSHGQFYRIAGITADITDRRRTEEALRETTQTLQALVQAAPVAITILDLEGKVRLWNPAAECILGWSEAESVGQPLPWLQSDSLGDSGGLLSTVLQGQTIHRMESKCRREDGILVEVSLSAAPLRDTAGTLLGALVLLMDLTEQKRLEDQLRQAQKMEAVGQLAGGVAHDFNNLLTIITGYSHILLADLKPGDSTLEFLEQIKLAGERAASLTRQLLAFGRKQTLQVQVLDLNTLVCNIEKMLRRLIGEDIVVVIEQDPLLGQVQADPGQLEQVLLNLAVNARDAMPRGGTLTLTTTNVELDDAWAQGQPEVVPGYYVQIAVRDTGTGMSTETMGRIFEPFFTTKEVGKGTGLGLATVYGIVKQSGGHIEVDSELGQGSTFRIYLPRFERADSESRAQDSPSDIPRGKETVLLVEDEENVREFIHHSLRLSGYTVLRAGSGQEALKLCEEHKGDIDLLVTDVIMPHMNGRELAERAVTVQQDLSVLYISGYTDNILDNHGILAPGTAFLHKPVTPRTLAKKVREVLDRRNPSRQLLCQGAQTP
jgi:two-component system cell cycle sensor histidine kinase/response regulator CckA